LAANFAQIIGSGLNPLLEALDLTSRVSKQLLSLRFRLVNLIGKFDANDTILPRTFDQLGSLFDKNLFFFDLAIPVELVSYLLNFKSFC